MLDARTTVAEVSTSPPRATRSSAGWIASGGTARRDSFLEGLSDNALGALPWLFDFWALPHQAAPGGDWRTWVILGGRGAGKTRAGAEWIRRQVEGARPLDAGRAGQVALVGETYDQVRDVMIEGESGIMACSPPDRRPAWQPTRRRLEWPNGATARAYSANDPDALRGPQFDAAWADEFAKWPNAQATWDMLQFTLRVGDDPRAVVTTTPRSSPALRGLLERPTTVTTHAPTEANSANLSDAFLREVRARYGGTRLGRQELDGRLLTDEAGAFWTQAMLDDCRTRMPDRFDRVVIGIDPAVSSAHGSDETGIIVVGVTTVLDRPIGWVLEDASIGAARPAEWAAIVARAYSRWGADRVIAEGNQGGEMIEAVLRQVAPDVSYRKVSARQGKSARAEPVAALYEQGRVRHAPGLETLEDQMCLMTARGYRGAGSPDRVDALVWALWAALLEPDAARRPMIRSL